MMLPAVGALLLICAMGAEAAACKLDFQCLPITMCMVGSVPTCEAGGCTCTMPVNMDGKRPLVKESRQVTCQANLECLYTSCSVGVSLCHDGQCICPGPREEAPSPAIRKRRETCQSDFECFNKNSCFVGPSVCRGGECTCTGPVERELSPAVRNRRFSCTNNWQCSSLMLCFVGTAYCSNGVCRCP